MDIFSHHCINRGVFLRYETLDICCKSLPCNTQSTVQPVPTRHRRHACIQMQTALSGNTRTWPNVVSMLAQRRWRWATIETALGQILVFAGRHTGVFLHPPLPSIIFSPADQGTFSKTAGQSQAYYNTWNWEWGTYDVTHLHILRCEVAVSRAGSVTLSMHIADFCLASIGALITLLLLIRGST